MRSTDGDVFFEEVELFGFGSISLFSGNVFVFDHTAKNVLLAGNRQLRIGSERGVASGRLRKTGKKSRLGESKIFCFFTKVSFGSGFDTINGSAVRGVVEVKFENLVFVVGNFGGKSENSLFDFAGNSAPWIREEGVFDQLLSDSRTSL